MTLAAVRLKIVKKWDWESRGVEKKEVATPLRKKGGSPKIFDPRLGNFGVRFNLLGKTYEPAVKIIPPEEPPILPVTGSAPSVF